ncbi:hypothetical protein S40293_07550, partial [Stachybotrys chartarum IBT 40293]
QPKTRERQTVLTSGTAGPDIKEEPNGFGSLDFQLPPDMALKRALDNCGNGDASNHDPGPEPEPKRVKVEDASNTMAHPEMEGESLEDDLALLVQNALSGVEDLVGQFNDDSHHMEHTEPPADVQPTHSVEAPEPPVVYLSQPEKYIRDTTLAALGNLSLSMLLILSQQPLDETLRHLRQPDSEHAISFQKLRGAFEAMRCVYSASPVIPAAESDPSSMQTNLAVELANLATLGTWLLDDTPNSLIDVDSNLLHILAPRISESPSTLIELYIAIRTHRIIEAALAKGPDKAAQIQLAETFDERLEEPLRTARSGSYATEQHERFLSLVQSRKDALTAEIRSDTDLTSLRQKYPADDVLRCYAAYVRGRVLSAEQLATKFGVSIPPNYADMDLLPAFDGAGNEEMDLDDLSSFFERTTSGLVQDALAGLTGEEEVSVTPTVQVDEVTPSAENGEEKKAEPAQHTNTITDYKELEALVAESTSNYVKTTLHGLSPVPYQPTVPLSTAESMAAQSAFQNHLQQNQNPNPYYSYTQAVPEPQAQAQPPASGEQLPPNQTFPSSILYDRARQAALTKSTAHTRREGNHSTRRPWTQEEEKALMHGLDLVQGPHWSQILTYFGRNGTISDILKERTQVQLKDKARNLKLFFLKANTEMPFYLNTVTGELKTRAPTQAARKEAEERARMNSEEDKAKLQGIMTLAGLQHPPQARAGGSPAGMVGASVVTPAQAASAVQAVSSGQTPTVPQTAHGASAAPAAAAAISAQQPASTIPPKVPQSFQSVPQAPPRPQGQYPQSLSPYAHPQPDHSDLAASSSPTIARPQPASASAPTEGSPHQPMGQPLSQHPSQTMQAQNQQPNQTQAAQPTYQPPAQQTSIANGSTQAQPVEHTHQTMPSATNPAEPLASVETGQTNGQEALALPSDVSNQAHSKAGKSPIFDDAAEAALLQGLQAAVAAELDAALDVA